jgi:hypothetical protein
VEAPPWEATPTPDPVRAPLRQAMREEDPRIRAARRAAEIREHVGDMDEGSDDFYVPKEYIPDGWDYEWKVRTVLGLEDPAQQVALARKGWEPVPASRHPEMMPHGTDVATIERKGLVLMERPKELSDEARSIELRRARNQVRAKEQQLSETPSGQLTRDDARVQPRIKKGYEPMPVPADS